VFPGDKDKLLFYFQSGGACWDDLTTNGVPFCSTDCVPINEVGIFNRSNINNAFKSYTVVYAMYCSGDVWGGNVTRSYKDSNGVPVSQQGSANAAATLNWVMQQQKLGSLATKLTDLVVMGGSAGSIGAQLWANEILVSLPWTKAAVVPDSFVGFFPPGTEGPLIYDFGVCSGSFLTKELKSICLKKELTMDQVTLSWLSMNPTVPFSFIQSKEDEVQYSYYIAIAVTENADPDLTPAQFYAGVNEILQSYNANSPNFLVYMIDGIQHQYTPFDLYYTADAISTTDNGKL
jgi:hypothetical protein